MRRQLNAEQEQHTVQVWPECWHAVLVFCAMGSQWRITEPAPGVLRYHGLDYAALPPVLDEHRSVPHAQPHPTLMAQLRHIESTALRLMRSER